MTTETVEKRNRLQVFRRLGYKQEEAVNIVEKLNILLANYHIHYQKLRNFHWNVQGPDFFDLHEKFEEQYNEAKSNIDDIAERIKVFGYTPYSTLKEYLDVSEVKEAATDLPSNQMVQEVINDYQILLTKMVEVANAAIDVGDVGTEDMINTFIHRMEKMHWMFSAFLKKNANAN